jgi:hypothetical protein
MHASGQLPARVGLHDARVFDELNGVEILP